MRLRHLNTNTCLIEKMVVQVNYVVASFGVYNDLSPRCPKKHGNEKRCRKPFFVQNNLENSNYLINQYVCSIRQNLYCQNL